MLLFIRQQSSRDTGKKEWTEIIPELYEYRTHKYPPRNNLELKVATDTEHNQQNPEPDRNSLNHALKLKLNLIIQ